MLCPDCGYDNIAGLDACEACGQPLIEFDFDGGELERCLSSEPISVLKPKRPVTIDASSPMDDAVCTMVEQRIGCLLVTDGEALAGVVTERDVLNKVSAELSLLQRPVSDFMTSSPVTVAQEDTMAYALQSMHLAGCRHMPIVDEAGRPRGIISVRDIFRYLCHRFAENDQSGER